MFEIAKELLERIEAAFFPLPQFSVNAASINYACGTCSGTCKHSCTGDCKGSCKGGCTRSCRGNSR